MSTHRVQFCNLAAFFLPQAESWAVAHTRARAEKRLAAWLRDRNIGHFLPLICRRHKGNREIRYFDVPLFPGYVFFDEACVDRQQMLATDRVAQVLTTPDQQSLRRDLERLARALQADGSLVAAPWGEVGRPVRVARGALKGLSGEVVRVADATRLLIRINFIGRAATLEIDEGLVEAE